MQIKEGICIGKGFEIRQRSQFRGIQSRFQCMDVFVAKRHPRINRVGDPASQFKASRADSLGSQKGMIDAPQLHTNDQYNRKCQLYGQFGTVRTIREWNTKTANAFDDDGIGLIADCTVTRHDVMIVDHHLVQFGREMGAIGVFNR